jgi:cytoskeleton protein RodZ
MAGESGSDQRCGIGARLRAGREKAGLTLLQAAEKLHIDPRMLEALESERFDLFGAKVYVRGYLRNYAALVGERFGELLELLDASHNRTPTPDLSRAPGGGAARQMERGRRGRSGVVLGVVAVVLGAVWWALSRGVA